jgi:anti-sigma regulatory factor (Ser/Thr protein kinase)
MADREDAAGHRESRLHDDGASLHLALQSDLLQIGEARRQVDAFLRERDAAVRTIYGAALCLEELLTNVIQHGYEGRPGQPIVVVVSQVEGGFRLVIEDLAPAFDPTTVAPPSAATSIDEAAIGGRGLAMVREYARSIRHRRDGGCNRLIVDLAN